MTPERWQQVNELFTAVVELDRLQRAAFLDQTCSNDQNLRIEVESLLASDERGWAVIERPAIELAAPLLANDKPQLTPGQDFSHYEIVNFIGKGGMGEVYLAKDKLLKRRIALKLLPADYAPLKDRLKRFQQEAEHVSALNHPNILTIHEFGEIDGQQFIATEFVEGETLRQRLRRGELTSSETIDIVTQVAGALAAAHKAGIVHRDIKPENIMLRPDGYVKVLDFGLAKLAEQQERSTDPLAENRIDVSSGVVMGTVKYMSPEQARGLTVDHRTDVWSLGVILYEMLTGCSPFEGATSTDVIAAILEREPTPLSTVAPNAPMELQRIVERSLRKDREERFQAVKEMLLGLEVQETGAGRTKVVQRINSTRVSGLRTSPKRWTAILVLVPLLVIVLGVAAYQFRQRNSRSLQAQPAMKITVLSNGGAWVPTVSPDGKHVAYVADNAKGEMGVWIRVVATGHAWQLVAPAGVNYAAPFFSRDGDHLYYSVQDMNNMSEYFLVDYYRIPIAGGVSTRILSRVGGLTLSPDAKQMAFIRVLTDRQTHELIICNDDGSNQRVIATRHWPEISWGPSWSPDGSRIAFSARNRDSDNFYNTVMSVPVEGGPEQTLTSRRWLDVGIDIWLADGSGLLVTGKDQLTDPMQIYFVSYPGGEVRRVTNDTNSYSALSITADSRSLVAEVADVTSNIWVTTDEDLSRAHQISTGGKDGIGGLAWTPDGKIAYATVSRDSFNNVGASGNPAIWTINSDGSNPRQLTTGEGVDTNPAVTADGRQIVFASHRAGAWGIWRAEMDGSNSTLLVTGGTTTFPVCSPDNRWVFFRRLGATGPPTIWKVPLNGGEAVQLTRDHANYPAVSPDGQSVAFFSPSETKIRLLVIPSAGGGPARIFDVAPETGYMGLSERFVGVSTVATLPTSRIKAIRRTSGASPMRVALLSS